MTTRVSELVQQIVEDIRRRALDVIGEDNVRCIFVSGSACRDEVTAHEQDGVIELYSDVDVGVVVAPSVDPQAVKNRLRKEVGAIARSGDGFRSYAPPDVGVYRPAELSQQSARPGTVNLVNARVIHGDAALLHTAAASIGSSIEPTEALYLLENRLNEIVEAERLLSGGDAGEARYALYIGLKCCLDIATAVLVAVGRYEDTRSGRMRLLEDAEMKSRIRATVGEDVTGEIGRAWSSLKDLPAFFADSAGREQAILHSIHNALAESWRGIAKDVYHGHGTEWSGLLRNRVRHGKQLRNARELLAVARRMRWSGPGVYRHVFTLRMVSAVELLRITSLLEAAAKGIEGRHETLISALDTLTCLGGFEEGDVFERGRALNRAIT